MRSLWIVLGLTVALAGCQDEQKATTEAGLSLPTFFVDGYDVIVMHNDSRAKGLELHTLVMNDAPVLPPASAVIAYDENSTVRITSPLSGRVISTPIPLGEQIKKGDVLLKLDSPDFNDALSALEKSNANLRLMHESFERAKKLFDGKVMARKDYEQAQDDLANAQSEQDRARKFLEKLGVQMGGVSTQTGAFHLRSPLSGIITEATVNPGMEVSPSLANPLYVVADLSKLWLWIDVFEKDIARVQQGQPISVKVSSWADFEFYGHIDYISQVVNETTRSIRVRCALENPDLKLLPAMHASVSIRNLPGQPSLMVPLSAVIAEGDQNFVFIKTSEDRFHWQAVQLGIRFEKEAIVRVGLKAGDQVVSNGALALRQDMLLSKMESTQSGKQ
jgi:cobalt-zinc-cadmium efflux system membrane fusion protein